MVREKKKGVRRKVKEIESMKKENEKRRKKEVKNVNLEDSKGRKNTRRIIFQ